MTQTRGIAAFGAAAPLGPWSFERRAPGPNDVQIQILFCGICHSDLHTVRGEWGPISYPQVPGHEIVGRVVSTGSAVTRWKAGDMVGVGCMVDSCRTCPSCEDGLEQYCEAGMTGTYGGVEKQTGLPTQGGYSNAIVVDDRYVLRIPDGMDPAGAAPLLGAAHAPSPDARCAHRELRSLDADFAPPSMAALVSNAGSRARAAPRCLFS